jgi:hypothetical protein
VKGEYEPFSPSVIYEVASYTTTIGIPGTYYAAVLATEEETDYSFVAGYKEQFTAAEWLLIPVSGRGSRPGPSPRRISS